MLKHNLKLDVEFKKSQLISKIVGKKIFTDKFISLLSKEIGMQVKDHTAFVLEWLSNKFIDPKPPKIINSGN